MRRVFVVLAAILAALSAVACPSAVEEPDPDPTGGGGTAPVRWGDSECGACVAEACAEPITACESEPECAAYVECLRDCPLVEGADAEPACEAACPIPSGAAADGARKALELCRASGPGVECASCGRAPSLHPLLSQTCASPTALDACDRCEEEFCCETRCDAECQSYVSCIQACGGMLSCEDTCNSTHAAGAQKTGSWLGCQTALCPVCGGLVPGECFQCALDNCPNQFAACFDDRSCFLRFLCGRNCQTDACYDDCDDRYPEADALFASFLLCTGESCIGGACDGAF